MDDRVGNCAPLPAWQPVLQNYPDVLLTTQVAELQEQGGCPAEQLAQWRQRMAAMGMAQWQVCVVSRRTDAHVTGVADLRIEPGRVLPFF